MSQYLEEAARHLPTLLHQLDLLDKVAIATIQTSAGAEIQYGDIRGALQTLERAGVEPGEFPERTVRVAKVIANAEKFTGVVYLGISVEAEQVEAWLADAKVGRAISELSFLHGSVSRQIALRHGSNMLIRLLSCSGAIVRFDDSEDDEVMFNSGERFGIVCIERRDYGPLFGKVWTADAEEMYWPTPNVPHWPEWDQ